MSEVDNLLAAIAALESQRAALGDATVASAIEALRLRLLALQPERGPATEGEWKQVTVLFADISGFTALTEITSAEVVRSTINACFEQLGAVVARYGGYIDKFIGDEIMVLFGAPRALEDHASKALYAALEMRDAVARFNRSMPALAERALGVHFGINSGLVVAGAMGTEERRDYTVLGDAVNVAARLVDVAQPGEILVGASTQQLGGHDFEFEERGPVQLEGHAPVNVYLLDRARFSVPHRGGASIQAGMVGRDRELRALQAELRAVASQGRTRQVVAFGPAGIGKTRLLIEFRAWLAAQHADITVVQGAAFSHMSATPYFAVADLIRGWLGVSQTDSGSELRRRLDAALARLGVADAETVHALGAILAIEYADDSLRDLLPETKRQRIFAAFKTFCEKLTADAPAVIVFEDVHWADDLSLALLEYLPRELDAPVLLFVLSRSDVDPAAAARQIESRLMAAGYTPIALRELDDPTSRDLVTALAPGIEQSAELVKAVVDRSEGNPFFTEAIIASLFDQEVLVNTLDGLKIQRAGQAVHVPETVWSLLAERIDQLQPAERRVIQSAAVVGRVFWDGLVSVLSETKAEEPLDALHGRQFIDPLGPAPFPGDWEWQFRHVLVQDVAYSSLLHETRKTAHLKVGEWLESRLGDRLGEYAPLLAQHYTAGESWEKAAAFSELAGDRASDLFSYEEARLWYSRVLDALNHLEPGELMRRRRVEVALKLSGASYYTPTQEIYAALAEAAQLAQDLDDKESSVKVMAAVASWQYIAGEGPAAVETATRTIALATEAGLEQLLSVPYSLLGKAMFVLGDFEKSGPVLEKSRLLAETSSADALARFHQGADAGYLGMIYELRGEFEKAVPCYDECLRLAEQRNDVRLTGSAHIYMRCIAELHGEPRKNFGHLEKAVDLLVGTGELVAEYCALGFLGLQEAQAGRLEQARDLLDRSLAIAEGSGSYIYLPLIVAFSANQHIQVGDFDKALEEAQRAVVLAVQTRQALGESEGRRILAWALHYSKAAAEADAEQELRRAIDLARGCAARVLEARLRFELAEFLRQTGNQAGASEVEAEATTMAETLGANWLPLPPPAPAPAHHERDDP